MLEIPPFRLDLAEERLWRGSAVVPLRPRSWAVLRYLVERPGRLVRPEEILDAVWADAAVTPNTLNTSIRELRKAFGDDARSPRFIETVHRRGFRFIGEFGKADEAASQAGPRLSRPVAPLAKPASLHGRSDALAELEARLAEARAGRRQIVFVTGEIGIGKTSLLRAFAERHEQVEGKIRVAWGQSVRQRGEGEAYLPVLDALDRLSRSDDREPLRATLRRFAPAWLLQLPWLLEPGEGADLRRELGEVLAPRMLREFCVATEVLASDPVLVLVLEDLHWSDVATVELIGALAERSEPARLLLLGSYRPVDAAVREHPIAPLRRALQQRGAASELCLDALPDTAVESYLCERFNWQEAPAGLASLIADQVEGNPLFLVTLMNYLVFKQLLRCSEGAWSLAVPPESLAAAAPESLRDIVEDQLGMLSAREQNVLEAASAIGVSFAVQALAAGVEADVEELEETCGGLAQRGLFIEERELERWPDGTVCRRFGFQHSAFQRILYGRLSPSRRQRLHLRIGERIEAGHGEELDARSAALASHFEQGGDRPRAITYLARAASVSQERFAHREAAGYLRRALELLEQTPESDARAKQELELRLQLGRDLSIGAGFGAEDVRENLGRCLELSRRLGDERSQGFVLDRIARQQLFRSEHASLRGTLGQLLPIASRIESAALATDASLLAAHADMLCGELERADRGFARVRSAEIDPSDAFDQIGHYSVILGLGLGTWCTAQRGRAEEARCQSDAARSALAVHREPMTIAGVYLGRAELGRLVGQVGLAREALETLRSEFEPSGTHFPVPTLYAIEGWLLLESGEAADAITLLRESLQRIRRERTTFWTTSIFSLLAESFLRKGDAPEGLRAIDEALAYVAEVGERVWEAELHRLRGELLRLQGGAEAAEPSFQGALEISRRQGARAFELRAATSLARLWQAKGDPSRARGLLEPVLGSFDQGRDTRDFLAGRALLQAL